MKESVKSFFEDYKEACRVSNNFYKKHWKGSLVMVGAIWAVEFTAIYALTKIGEKKLEKDFKRLEMSTEGDEEES